MTKTQPIEFPDFNQRIEQMLEEHAAACRAAVLAAVERAFPTAVSSTSTLTGRSRRPGKKARKSGTTPRLVQPLARRTPKEMAAVVERLYQAVCSKPGESKAVLAAEMRMPARELNRPMELLRRDGKVRSVGARHLTRYFPLVADVAQISAPPSGSELGCGEQ
jgi:hypothetical protein